MDRTSGFWVTPLSHQLRRVWCNSWAVPDARNGHSWGTHAHNNVQSFPCDPWSDPDSWVQLSFQKVAVERRRAFLHEGSSAPTLSAELMTLRPGWEGHIFARGLL